MPSTYTGYRCKCGYGIHTTFDGSKINPCKECGNTSMRGEEISMDNYEKLPLPRITRGWEFFLSLDDNSPKYVLPSRAAILDTHTEGEEE
jgi:hypothetical protein